ncbi:MAG: Rab family GTPase [Candidatus Hodarchaeota archaeon]
MSAEIEDGVWKFKIILAGAGAVGKTTLMNRFVSGPFAGEYKATIGVDILSKELILNKEDKTHLIKLQIWDIAGQELFRAFRKRFFSNARGCLLIFDLTVPQTLNDLHTWVSDIYEIAGSIPIVLIGNKVDLKELRNVSTELIDSFQKDNHIPSYFLTSAVTGVNVDDAFKSLIHMMVPFD